MSYSPAVIWTWLDLRWLTANLIMRKKIAHLLKITQWKWNEEDFNKTKGLLLSVNANNGKKANSREQQIYCLKTIDLLFFAHTMDQVFPFTLFKENSDTREISLLLAICSSQELSEFNKKTDSQGLCLVSFLLLCGQTENEQWRSCLWTTKNYIILFV